MKVIIHNLLRSIRNFLVSIFGLFPLQNYIIFESNPDFNDEGYWVCKKFLEERVDENYKIFWMIKNRKSVEQQNDWNVSFIYVSPKGIVEWIRKWYILYTAKIILDSCDFIPKKRKGQFRLFLTHGFALKNAASYIKLAGDLDYYNICSPYFIEFHKQLGIKENQMVYLGLARNDNLNVESVKLKNLFYVPNNMKMIMWMPTYRQHANSVNGANIPIEEKNVTGMPVLKSANDFEKINNILKEKNTILVIKLHQSQNMDCINIDNFSNIRVITTDYLMENYIQLYGILSEFDALITDYSSIYYDFLLLDRPIALTVDDLELYEKNVGFAVNDYKKEIRGFYIKNVDDLVQFIELLSDDVEELLSLIKGCKEYFHTVTDFTSAEQIYSFVIKEKNRKEN